MVPVMALDRRARTRTPDPPCPVCRVGPDHVRVTNRTTFRLFCKCDQCGNVWTMDQGKRRQTKQTKPTKRLKHTF